MAGGDTRNGLQMMEERKAGGDDAPVTKASLPPCCIKALASLPESDARCHATVVSGWFSQSHGLFIIYIQCLTSQTPCVNLTFLGLI